jgi:hypothetical protein
MAAEAWAADSALMHAAQLLIPEPPPLAETGVTTVAKLVEPRAKSASSTNRFFMAKPSQKQWEYVSSQKLSRMFQQLKNPLIDCY